MATKTPTKPAPKPAPKLIKDTPKFKALVERGMPPGTAAKTLGADSPNTPIADVKKPTKKK